jgi:hypothetical protein
LSLLSNLRNSWAAECAKLREVISSFKNSGSKPGTSALIFSIASFARAGFLHARIEDGHTTGQIPSGLLQLALWKNDHHSAAY